MITAKVKADLILLLAAAIWGFAFVAQRVGMDYVGPYTYNGVRFSLGVLVLLPFFYKRLSKGGPMLFPARTGERNKILMGSLLTGLFLFAGVALQQLGLQKTTAGKAGFLTELYVAFVPVIGLFFGQRSNWYIWAGVLLSMAGLYFLSVVYRLAFTPDGFHTSCRDTVFDHGFHQSLRSILDRDNQHGQNPESLATNLLWRHTFGWAGLYSADHSAKNRPPGLRKHHPWAGSCFCCYRRNAAAWRDYEFAYVCRLLFNAFRDCHGPVKREIHMNKQAIREYQYSIIKQ